MKEKNERLLKTIKAVRNAEKFLEELAGVDFYELFLDSYGFPEDNSSDEKYHKFWQEHDESVIDSDFFCRDYLYDILYDYSEGKINFERCEELLIDELEIVKK